MSELFKSLTLPETTETSQTTQNAGTPASQPAPVTTPTTPPEPENKPQEPIQQAQQDSSSLGSNSPQSDPDEEEEIIQPSELDMLKNRARLMGINFSNNIGIDALKAKIEAKKNGESTVTNEENIPESPIKTHENKPMNLRQRILAENMKLVRLRITNLDPKKKDLPGEIFTVANEYLGTVRKFIPYGEVTDNGYHVPYCIYKQMKKRKFLNIKVTMRNGREHVEQTWAQEFALEVLPQLTEAELNRLAQAQMAAGSVE